MLLSIVLAAFLLQTAPPNAPAAGAADPSTTPSAYVPERVFDTRRATFSDFEAMLADLAHADVILVGEQHDDPNTHRLEAAILEGLGRRGVSLTVSLEMFERDVQESLEAYLAGRIGEEAFLGQARPWPRYQTDYRPLVEMARTRGWPVLAANVPRLHAAAVARSGLDALRSLTDGERGHVAADMRCPLDGYYDRFAAVMAEHPVPGSEQKTAEEQRETTERYYLSQCVKDETMASAIAEAVERRSPGRAALVHFTGAFHSDFGTGVTERVRRRLPDRRVVTVSILPVEDLDWIAPAGDDLRRAEYLVYTLRRPPAEMK